MKTEKLKNSKGITLIALIITIIVMLILVGVTVNVAMQGGLFNAASDASKKTQAEAYKEELSAAVAGAYDAVTGEINGDKLASNLGTKWSVEGTGPYTCAINGDAFNAFTVSKKGEIELETFNATIITDLRKKSVGDKYILNNVEYVVASKDNQTATLIVTEPLGSVTIGVEDNSVEGTTDIEKAVNSYNNAFVKIQAECERVIGYEDLSKDIISVRNARAYSANNNPNGGYYVATFQSISYNNKNDLDMVKAYVNVDNLHGWYITRYDGHSSGADYGIGVFSTATTSVYGDSNSNLFLMAGTVIPFNNTVDGEVKPEYIESIKEAYTHTYGVIPIVTVNLQ